MANEQLATTPILTPEATLVQSKVEQEQNQTQESEPHEEKPENHQLIKQQQQQIQQSLQAEKQLWNDIKVIYNGRDILDICSNFKNSWNIRYTYLPENNFQMYLANRSQYHRLGDSYNTREYSLDICRRCYFQHPVKFQEPTVNNNSDDIMPLVTIFPDNHHLLSTKYAGISANRANTPNRINAINILQSSSNHDIGSGAIAANAIVYANHTMDKSLKSRTPTNFYSNNTNKSNNNTIKTNCFNGIINAGLGNIGIGNFNNNNINNNSNHRNGMEVFSIGSTRMNSNNNNYINMVNLTLPYSGIRALPSASSPTSSATVANTNIINSIINNGNPINSQANNMMTAGINNSGNGGAIPKQYPNMNRSNYNQTSMNFNAANKMPYKMYSHF